MLTFQYWRTYIRMFYAVLRYVLDVIKFTDYAVQTELDRVNNVLWKINMLPWRMINRDRIPIRTKESIKNEASSILWF